MPLVDRAKTSGASLCEAIESGAPYIESLRSALERIASAAEEFRRFLPDDPVDKLGALESSLRHAYNALPAYRKILELAHSLRALDRVGMTLQSILHAFDRLHASEELDSTIASCQHDSSSCVYLLLLNGKLKIGTAKNVRRRIAALQTASADRIQYLASVPGSVRLETLLHRKFSRYRIRHEWFMDVVEIREWFFAHPCVTRPRAETTPTPVSDDLLAWHDATKIQSLRNEYDAAFPRP